MTRLLAAAVVALDRVLRPGWVEVDADQVVAVGQGEDESRGDGTADLDLGDVLVVPGFVDVHCHGGGGAVFGDDVDLARAAAATHLAHGTTTLMASLVTGPRAQIAREIAALAPLVEEGTLAGIHLEGPRLSRAYCGAHSREQLRSPSADELTALVSPPAVRMVTLAPELDGGLDAVRRIVDLGAVAAVGHTDADHATTVAAIAAGASHATHLFNAMRPLRLRDAGPVVALLERDDVTLELIRDGVHLDAALCAWLDETVAPDRLVAVTDAMAAAGHRDGRYALGGLDIEVSGGVALVAGTTTIAGSTATMDQLFRAVAGEQPTDESLLRAVRQTAANPARVLGRDDIGRVAAGARADLVVLDGSSLEVRAVMRSGGWVTTVRR
jgi:N-acetylglucosamine-6-phosphate deacetylase